MDYDQAMFLFGGCGKGSLIRFMTPMPGMPQQENSEDEDTQEDDQNNPDDP